MTGWTWGLCACVVFLGIVSEVWRKDAERARAAEAEALASLEEAVSKAESFKAQNEVLTRQLVARVQAATDVSLGLVVVRDANVMRARHYGTTGVVSSDAVRRLAQHDADFLERLYEQLGSPRLDPTTGDMVTDEGFPLVDGEGHGHTTCR